jgi:hypothetical protein
MIYKKMKNFTKIQINSGKIGFAVMLIFSFISITAAAASLAVTGSSR